jgi:hypothetical protein
MKCHGIAFEAVAVIIQYQMDNGAPIFNVKVFFHGAMMTHVHKMQ